MPHMPFGHAFPALQDAVIINQVILDISTSIFQKSGISMQDMHGSQHACTSPFAPVHIHLFLCACNLKVVFDMHLA